MRGFFTRKGEELDAKLQGGTPLCITRGAAGGGKTDKSAVVLERECQALPLGSHTRRGTTAVLYATLTDVQAQADYTMTEIGIYARDPDEGEILYQVFPLEPEFAVTAGAGQLTIRFELELTVSEATEVSVLGTAAGLLTEGDLLALRGVPDGVAGLGGDGKVPAEQLPDMGLSMCLLWENAAPTSSFAAQTITLPENAYTHFAVIFKNTINLTSPLFLVQPGDTANCGVIGSNGSNIQSGDFVLFTRYITNITQTSVTFSDCKEPNQNWYVNNNNLMPICIYGVKGVPTA